MPSIINDVQVGQDTRINIQSLSHGRKRVPMVQTMTITPKESAGVIGEFDNRSPVMTYHTYESAEITFEAMKADQADLDCMIMDQDPNEAIVVLNKENVKENTIWVNYLGKNTGNKYSAEYLENCVCDTSTTSSTIKDPTKNNYKFLCGRYLRFTGKTGQKCAIQYNRFVNTPLTATPDDIALTGSTGTFPKAPVSVPIPDSSTQNYIRVVKNGTPMTYGTDFTIAGLTLTLVVSSVSGDVVECWTVVQDNVA